MKASAVLLFSFIFCLAFWVNTGTLSPYAASHHLPTVLPACEYLVNLDHEHFLATYRFMIGADSATWEWSVVLRRVLYPIIAYPFMDSLGYLIGGVVASFFIQLFSFLVFVRFVWRKIGSQAGLVAAGLLSTYPGTFYWSGLPYSYALIVPCSLLGFMVLSQLSEVSNLSSIAFLGLLLGVLFTGYDLLPYFGFAALLVLLMQRKFVGLPVVLISMVLPSIAVGLVLKYLYGLNLANVNSNIYGQIINAYLDLPVWAEWWPLLASAPGILLHNFTYSNFIFLPLLFVLSYCIGRVGLSVRLNLVELSLLFAVFSVFLFNNLAPPYPGKWQLRGVWIARLYQPVFVVFLIYSARVWQEISCRSGCGKILPSGVLLSITAAIVANGLITFGAYLAPAFASRAYYEFYQHSTPVALVNNIEKYGKRPLGFCRQAEKGKRVRRRKRRRDRAV